MSRFKPSYKGIGLMLKSAEMQAEMLRRAELVLARAEATAPVYTAGPHPGQYKRSFKVSSGVRRGRNGRAYGRVSNDSPEGRWVEYGTRNNPRHRTLGRALDAAKG